MSGLRLSARVPDEFEVLPGKRVQTTALLLSELMGSFRTPAGAGTHTGGALERRRCRRHQQPDTAFGGERQPASLALSVLQSN